MDFPDRDHHLQKSLHDNERETAPPLAVGPTTCVCFVLELPSWVSATLLALVLADDLRLSPTPSRLVRRIVRFVRAQTWPATP